MMTDAEQNSPFLVAVEGCFDSAQAWRIHELLAQLGVGARATIDLRRAQRIEDSALALLAPDLAGVRGRLVSVLGLGVHQYRVLRYLGVGREQPC